MDFKLTTQDVWGSTVAFALAGLLLLIPLVLVSHNDDFQRSALPIALTSAIVWGVFAIVAFWLDWDIYYQYIYPPWARWLAFASALFYGLIALGMWRLANLLPVSAILWFVILGGLEGIAEHLFGIYALHILEKVPWLQGITPLSALIFSFFEYILYWTVIAWFAFGLTRWGHIVFVPGES